ncbi:MAG: glucosaminidase domain-containing protein [Hyphomicrobiaceae bacterium]|nr:glucosaminidase domain-containing protein [Hyphomicrobiaceae bacterium]
MGIAGNPAVAADLPVLKTGGANKVPACATPGRMMSFATSRNGRISSQFDGVATEYMRHGEALSVRWDYAFFQMLVETANLSFVGDVRASQNNFAGLGATGGGVRGEKFASVSDGVKAHLQHILMYAGEHIADPVAERTRKVQEWGVLTSWQKSLRGPMTFAQLTRKWSPKDRGYARDIAAVAGAFYNRFCQSPDPRPELVAEARGQRGITIDTAAAIKPVTEDGKLKSGRIIAKAAIADTRATSGPARIALGAKIPAAEPPPPAAGAAGPAPNYTILNGASEIAASDSSGSDTTTDAARTNGEVKVASAAGAAAASAPATSAAARSSCRVWQASYGGQKAVIIQAIDGPQVNYTVLDVNEGREQREVAAYIAAYAKGGKQVAEFASPSRALNKAFEMCPES